MSDDICYISHREIELQKEYGYKVDRKLYKDLNPIKQELNSMNINITEQTTTFPCPVNKLKGRLMDEIGMSWKTDHGRCCIDADSIKWIMDNVKTSKYNNERCYVYNKAFARYYDNNNAHKTTLADLHMKDQYNGKTISGALAPTTSVRQNGIDFEKTHFDLIREWASKRDLYKHGDPKTQALKLVEEVGETCRAILKGNHNDIEDGIGDCVVVLPNLARLCNTDIEHCIESAYNEIKNRTGKMSNGTFKKD